MLTLILFLSAGFNQPKGKLKVSISNLRSNKGQVLIYLFEDEKGFPKDLERASFYGKSEIKDLKSSYTFENLNYGEYAAIAVHDENSDGMLDKSFLGMPKENIGLHFNNKESTQFPSFDNCKFIIDKKENTIELEVRF